jgi:hypothetical protein
VLALDDVVEHAVIEEKLGSLESLGELLLDGLFDDAGTGEADEGLGLRDVDVAQHGEAGRRPARRRIAEDGNKRQAGRAEPGDRGAGLDHLHQRQHALLHPGAAGAAEHRGPTLDKALPGEHGVLPTRLELLGEQTLGVGPEVLELERVARREVAEHGREGAGVDELAHAFDRPDAEVVLALRATVEIGLHLPPVDHLPARGAPEPESLGDGVAPLGLLSRPRPCRRCARHACSCKRSGPPRALESARPACGRDPPP